jgi:hypothetical protein
MSDGHQALREFSQTINQGIVEHLNSPPLIKNRNRAMWGAGLLAGGAYVAWTFMLLEGGGFWRAEHIYLTQLHRPLEDSWQYYAWGGVMVFGLLWVTVGLRGSRAPRDIMMAFWALAWVAGSGAALWYRWFPDDWPVVGWLLIGAYLMILASSVMQLYLAMRGTGPGAMRLIQQQIARQAKVFRLGRKRSF